jgi:hypothetical protein
MIPRTACGLSLLALLCLGSGCFFLPFDPVDEMRAGSPCLDVNLLDGLDETSSAEIQNLYDCLNQNGAFDAIEPVIAEVVDGSDRDIQPLAMHVAVVFNAVPSRIPLWETLGAVQQLLLEENAFLMQALQLVAEFVYGAPWHEVEQLEQAGELQNAAILAEGPIAHLVPVLRVWAEVILDADDVEDSGEILDHLLSMPELRDTLVTLRELLRDNDNHHLFDDFSENWGEFFLQAHDDTTGRNTLVDALDALVSPVPQEPGQPIVIEKLLEPGDEILSDVVARERLVDGIGDLYDDGTLSELPDQLRYLMTIDMHGGTLDPGEESALESALVLLDEADAPFDCFELIHTDSVSVWMLEEIVILGLEADSIDDLIFLIEDMYGWLIEVVDLLCEVPAVLKTHFDSIIRLAESGALYTLIPLLYAVTDPYGSEHNHLDAVIDLVQMAIAYDLVAPLEALLAPTMGQDFIPAVLAIVGAFVDPSYELAAGDVYTLLDVVDYLITPPDGEGYDRAPVVIAGEIIDGIIAGAPAELDAFLVTWGELLADPDAVTNHIMYDIEGLLDLDPDLQTLDYVGDILADEEICTHWLLVFENQGLMDALGAPGSAGGDEVPLAMLGRLIADGTAEDLILLLAWVTDMLGALGIEL